jgi:hypothetical protein
MVAIYDLVDITERFGGQVTQVLDVIEALNGTSGVSSEIRKTVEKFMLKHGVSPERVKESLKTRPHTTRSPPGVYKTGKATPGNQPAHGTGTRTTPAPTKGSKETQESSEKTTETNEKMNDSNMTSNDSNYYAVNMEGLRDDLKLKIAVAVTLMRSFVAYSPEIKEKVRAAYSDPLSKDPYSPPTDSNLDS